MRKRSSQLILKDNSGRGIWYMLVCVFFFAVMNICIKYTGAHINVYQVTFFRCLFSIIPVLVMVFVRTGFSSLQTKRWKGHFARGTTGTASLVLLFYSFRLLPLADAVAISFTGPLFVTLFSALFLKEVVGKVRWAALAAGFIGVIVIVRPWEGEGAVNWLGVFVGIASCFFNGLSMIGVRSLGRTEPSTTTVFYFTALSTLFMSTTLPFVWQPLATTDFLFLAASGIFAGLGQLYMTRSYQYAPAAVVSPYGYSAIFLAIIFGYFLWGEVPDWSIYVGGGIVILSGLAVYYYEVYWLSGKAKGNICR